MFWRWTSLDPLMISCLPHCGTRILASTLTNVHNDRPVTHWLAQWKPCSLWIGITSDSVHNMGANIWICLVYWFITSVIAYKLRQTYLIELQRGKCIRHSDIRRSAFGNQWRPFGAILGLHIQKRNSASSLLWYWDRFRLYYFIFPIFDIVLSYLVIADALSRLWSKEHSGVITLFLFQ